MDPAKPVVKMQLPGPERDGPAVLVGPDLLGQWVKNTYFDFASAARSTASLSLPSRSRPPRRMSHPSPMTNKPQPHDSRFEERSMFGSLQAPGWCSR